jgi:ABC-2 family transporter protein
MTTLATSAPLAISPVPLRRLAWVAWRRNRATVLGLGGLLAALSTYLVITSLQTHAAYDDLGSCIPPITTDSCRIQWTSFVDSHGDRGLMGPLLVVLPGIVGAVVGAPLIGRELESGVFRYSWTQGAGRMRWAVAVIIPVAIVSVVLMGALGLLVTWHNQPMVEAGSAQRLDTSSFPTTGLAVVGWTLLGFSVGVLAGLLWRRVVPAVATTFATWFGLAYLASVLRPHLLTPLTTKGDIPVGGMEISEHWTKGGTPVSLAEVSSVLDKVGVSMSEDGFSAHADKGSAAPPDPITFLSQHGYTHVHSYQPDSRYWTFQWIELGWLLVVSVVLLALTFWLVRRRSA